MSGRLLEGVKTTAVVTGGVLTTLLTMLLIGSGAAVASSREYGVELQHNRKVQRSLAEKQQQLKRSDATLAQQTEILDRALLQANRAFIKAKKELVKVDELLRKLELQRYDLQELVTQLQTQIAAEATAAWMHAGREPSWLDLLAGVPVEEIPHRKHIIELLILAHEEKKSALHAASVSLDRVQRKTEQRRRELAALKREKESRQAQLHDKRQQKSRLLREVRRNMRSGSRRLARLRQRERRLEQLLAQLDVSLKSSMRNLDLLSIRSQRGRLPWPMRGRVVASFGSRHPVSGRLHGVQIAPRQPHAKIISIASGQVKYADWFGGFGLTMVVDYGDNMVAVYAHNDLLYHQVGDWVEAGELLAQVGSTGWVERQLLYFELRDHGKPTDPKRWCRRVR
ncbi:MAG: peptidoglycan DD-metalloendopeptidase family protein [Mariprofundales bacterium]|nr:peptidoglycan DD-metalloendopeptidase family protein [Mariprofundales bacterium]